MSSKISDSSESGSPEKIPAWYWIVSGVALAWNLMGLLAFVAEFFAPPESLKTLPLAQQELFTNLPTWYWIVFAVAVVGGTLGCVGLLLRKSWATTMFLISLLGIIAQQNYMYLLSNTIEVLGISSAILPTLVLLVGLALIWFAQQCRGKGWLK